MTNTINTISTISTPPGYVAQASTREKQIIFDNIYFLKISELKSICFNRDIPTNIYYYKEGLLKKSGRVLHKKLLIKNILKHVEGKEIQKYVLNENMVNFETLKKPKANDYVYFGQYHSSRSEKLLSKLTDGIFKKGYVSFMILHKLWRAGKQFTYKQFAKAYIKNKSKFEGKEHKEWAYINHIKENHTAVDWKSKRKLIAKEVMAIF